MKGNHLYKWWIFHSYSSLLEDAFSKWQFDKEIKIDHQTCWYDIFRQSRLKVPEFQPQKKEKLTPPLQASVPLKQVGLFHIVIGSWGPHIQKITWGDTILEAL